MNKLKEKQPVVVMVGHIDHGKSSILEGLRDLSVLEKESGGITQHISTYEIEEKGQKITLIDTPGHAAFCEMRSRGASVADLAVLVVAADEGVKPQTEECISHLKESETPFVVAINKIDKPEANVKKIKSQLTEYEIVVEEMGGEVLCAEVSAETGKGLSDLLDLILLKVELMELKADFETSFEGVVIEAFLSTQRGALVNILINKGVLEEGKIISAGGCYGKVRRMENYKGKRIKKAFPGQAVQILGIGGVPGVGERVVECGEVSSARQLSEESQENVCLEAPKGCEKVLNIVLRVDVGGSTQPIQEVLSKLPQERVGLRVVRSGVGKVTLSDIDWAEATEAVIVAFRTDIEKEAEEKAKKKGVRVFSFDIIYELKEGVKKIMEGFLGPQKVRVNVAKLEVLKIFKKGKRRQVIGAHVEKGEVRKGNKIEVFKTSDEKKIKSGEGVGEGRIVGLQSRKKDIKSGKEGEDVGILFEGKGDIEEGDTLVAYEIRSKMMEL